MPITQEAVDAGPVTPPPIAHTLPEVAELLGKSYTTITRLCASGELRSRRVGRHLRVPVEALAEYQRKQAEQPPTLSPREAATALQVPYSTVLDLCRSGELDSERHHGNRLCITQAALDRYLAAHVA